MREGHASRAGIAHVGTDAGSPVGGADAAGHVAGARRIPPLELVGRLASQPGAGNIEFPHQRLGAIVGLGDAGGGEGIGLDDVGADSEILTVDVGDYPWLGERKQVAVAADVGMPVLEAFAAEVFLGKAMLLQQGAHGAIEQENAPGQQ